MSIPEVGPNGNTGLAELFQQRRDDMKTMLSAVRSGNINVAKTALAAYQKDNADLKAAAPPGSSPPPRVDASRHAKLHADLSALTSAIDQGSITDAQTALNAYSQDRGHDSTDTPASAASPPPATNDSLSLFVKDLTNLIKDAVSGNNDAAQKDAASLANDIVALFGAAQSDQTDGAKQTTADASSKTTSTSTATQPAAPDASDAPDNQASEILGEPTATLTGATPSQVSKVYETNVMISEQIVAIQLTV